jgi:hypothetical protein
VESKRKYRRHPKPDEHAPERPPSAYVIFSNKIRDEVKDQNLTFTQIAKLVGDRWQKLDPASKEPFEAQANTAKERYNTELSAYRKTDRYKEYTAYLADFKTKHGQSGEAKRPKLEPESSGSIISVKSFDVGQEQAGVSSAHLRGGSMGSSASSPFIAGSGQPSGSSGSIPTRSQLALSRDATPPPVQQQGRDYFRPSYTMSQSSTSDDTATMKSEVPETTLRTAGLSIESGSATPPPAGPLSSGSAFDLAGPADPLARSRLSYFVQQQQQQQQQVQQQQRIVGANSPTAQSWASGLSYPSTLSSPSTQEPGWQSRPTDLRNYQDAARGLNTVSPPIFPREPLPTSSQMPPMLTRDNSRDYPPGPSSRILPPPRVSSSGSAVLPHLGRTMDPLRPLSTEASRLSPINQQDDRSSFNRSESDAANALAGLASGVSRPGSAPSIERRRLDDQSRR